MAKFVPIVFFRGESLVDSQMLNLVMIVFKKHGIYGKCCKMKLLSENELLIFA